MCSAGRPAGRAGRQPESAQSTGLLPLDCARGPGGAYYLIGSQLLNRRTTAWTTALPWGVWATSGWLIHTVTGPVEIGAEVALHPTARTGSSTAKACPHPRTPRSPRCGRPIQLLGASDDLAEQGRKGILLRGDPGPRCRERPQSDPEPSTSVAGCAPAGAWPAASRGRRRPVGRRAGPSGSAAGTWS